MSDERLRRLLPASQLNGAPTAAELVAHPERIAELAPAALPAILAQLTAVASAVAAKLPTGPVADGALEASDRLMDVKEAAAMLGAVSEDFLYRSPDVQGLRIRLGGRVLFSYRKTQALIARRLSRARETP